MERVRVTVTGADPQAHAICGMPTLHTIGYEKRDMPAYLALLHTYGVTLVVDVRETAWSHKPGFSKAAFSAALRDVGVEYVHAAFAGNPKALRATARSHAECLQRFRRYLEERPTIVEELDALVYPALAIGDSVALTCFERHPHDCHRAILAEAWRGLRADHDVVHLAGEGCKRLVPT